MTDLFRRDAASLAAEVPSGASLIVNKGEGPDTPVLLVKEIVRQLAARGTAVLYSSHLLDVAQQLASRAVILHQGEIVADGPVAMLREGRPDATLEAIFRELTEDHEVETRAERFVNRTVRSGPVPAGEQGIQ